MKIKDNALINGPKIIGRIDLDAERKAIEKAYKEKIKNMSSTELSSKLFQQLDYLEYMLDGGDRPLHTDEKYLRSPINGFRDLRNESYIRGEDISFFDNRVAGLTSHLKYVPIAD